jgi:hypothetical protein
MGRRLKRAPNNPELSQTIMEINDLREFACEHTVKAVRQGETWLTPRFGLRGVFLEGVDPNEFQFWSN